MLTDLKVKVGPQFYRYHVGAIDFVSDLLQEFSAKNVLIVHGQISFEKAKPFLKFLNERITSIFYSTLASAATMEQNELPK